jgi:hypothetical protein
VAWHQSGTEDDPDGLAKKLRRIPRKDMIKRGGSHMKKGGRARPPQGYHAERQSETRPSLPRYPECSEPADGRFDLVRPTAMNMDDGATEMLSAKTH